MIACFKAMKIAFEMQNLPNFTVFLVAASTRLIVSIKQSFFENQCFHFFGRRNSQFQVSLTLKIGDALAKNLNPVIPVNTEVLLWRAFKNRLFFSIKGFKGNNFISSAAEQFFLPSSTL